MAFDAVLPWMSVDRRDRRSVTPVVAGAVAVVVYAVCVGVCVMNPRSGIGLEDYVWFGGWVVCAVCGALLARSPRGRRYGWFLLALGLCAEAEGVLGVVLHQADTSQWPKGVLASTALLKSMLELPPVALLLTRGLLLFPTGRLGSDSRWGRRIGSAPIMVTAVLMAAQLVDPGPLSDTDLVNPLGVNGAGTLVSLVDLAGFGILLGCLLAGIRAVIMRWRRGEPLERRAVGVVVCAAMWALAIVVLGVVLDLLHRTTPGLLGAALVAVTISALPLAALTTAVRRSMFDVELALNRNLTYLALTVIVVGGYALAVTALGRVFERHSQFGVSLVVTGLIAVLFGPLKMAVQQAVEYVLLGHRATPYRALTTLGHRLDRGLSPDDALAAAVRTVAETFRLPYVVLSIDVDGEPVTVASAGQPVALSLHYPVLNRGQRRGTLHLAPRSAYEKLAGSDERLLAAFVTQIAGAVEAVHLTEQLRHSRTAVVMASEEERRRIRRELHDGIGPVLASTALAVQRVERQLDSSDPRRTALADTRVDVQHAIDDIRRVVHGLRPAALDELGLAAAITHRARALSDEVTFDVRITDDLAGLPAAVEVVAYRVVTEAMTNVVRHAEAVRCDVEVRRDSHELVLSVRDDGRGLRTSRREGMGMSSMRERLSEIGGHLAVESDGRGTDVVARVALA